jgi:hypothetical protein
MNPILDKINSKKTRLLELKEEIVTISEEIAKLEKEAAFSFEPMNVYRHREDNRLMLVLYDNAYTFLHWRLGHNTSIIPSIWRDKPSNYFDKVGTLKDVVLMFSNGDLEPRAYGIN